MKNVLVVALGRERYALELRWIREVTTLGPVTPVPTAPPSIAGVVNVRGAITPVLFLPPLLRSLGHRTTADVAPPRFGSSSILIHVEDMRAVIAIDRVDSVTSMEESPRADVLADKLGRPVPLLDGRLLLQMALAHTSGVAPTPAVAEGA